MSSARGTAAVICDVAPIYRNHMFASDNGQRPVERGHGLTVLGRDPPAIGDQRHVRTMVLPATRGITGGGIVAGARLAQQPPGRLRGTVGDGMLSDMSEAFIVVPGEGRRLDLGNFEAIVLATAAQTSNEFTLLQTQGEPSEFGPPLHIHSARGPRQHLARKSQSRNIRAVDLSSRWWIRLCP
jgi:hypothetical protein